GSIISGSRAVVVAELAAWPCFQFLHLGPNSAYASFGYQAVRKGWIAGFSWPFDDLKLDPNRGQWGTGSDPRPPTPIAVACLMSARMTRRSSAATAIPS